MLAAVFRLSNLYFRIFKNFRLEEKRMAYNNGRENRKWQIMSDTAVPPTKFLIWNFYNDLCALCLIRIF